MNPSPATRLAALALSAVLTLMCVHSIASYAYPEQASTHVATAGNR